MLAGFARSEELYRIRSSEDRWIDSVVQMMEQTRPIQRTRSQIERERDLRKYIGDYALFMSGIFRPHVEKGGFLDYYFHEGSRSYRTVSDLDLALYRTGFLVFRELSEKFELYSGALDFLRKSRFAPFAKEDMFGDFLRQIDRSIQRGSSNN